LDDYYFKPFFRKHWLPGQPDEPDATIDEFYGRSKTYHSTHHVGPDDNSISETQVEFVAVAPIHPEMEPLFAFEKRRRSVSRSRPSVDSPAARNQSPAVALAHSSTSDRFTLLIPPSSGPNRPSRSSNATPGATQAASNIVK
jgi:hypothetical protein